VQQIRQMGMIDGDEPVSKNDWETVKRSGAGAIERWIDDNMKYKRCVVVLIGTDTHSRPWVKHEIRKAWADKRGLLGIRIHNLKCPNQERALRAPTRSTNSTSTTVAAASLFRRSTTRRRTTPITTSRTT
jgi:hypothetical protein